MKHATRLGSAVFAALLLVSAPAWAGDDHNVKIINETSHTMISFYASNVSENDWQEDILGVDTLAPGADVTIDIDDGSGHCKYDFKAVFQDNPKMQPIEIERDNIDVCAIDFYRYDE